MTLVHSRVTAGTPGDVPSPERKLTVGIVAWKFHFVEQRALLMEGHAIRVLPEPPPPGENKLDDISGLGAAFPGKITVVRTVEELVQGADLIVADFCGIDPDTIEEVHRLHEHVIGLDTFTQRLEENRAFGRMLASHIGLDINSHGKWCHSADEAQEFVEQHGLRVLFKSTSGVGLPTVIPPTMEDAFDLIEHDPFDWFEHDPEETLAPSGVFIDTMMEGREISYFGFFNGEKFQSMYGMTQEHKAACEGGRGGVLTGEVGTAFAFMPKSELPLRFARAFERLETVLSQTYYRGFVDLNTLVTDEGHVQFMEFTCRPGYPTEQEIISHLWVHGQSYGDWLAGIAGLGPEVVLHAGVGIGVALQMHGIGIPGVAEVTGSWQPIIHWDNPRTLTNATIQPFFACWDSKGRWRTHYLDRAVMAVGHADPGDWTNAIHRAYLTIQQVSAWGHTFRKDIPMRSPEYALASAMAASYEQIIDCRVWNNFQIEDVSDEVNLGTEELDWVCMLEWTAFDEEELWSLDLLYLICLSPNYQIYFARSGEEVLGMLIVRKIGDMVYVANIAVSPAARRMGIARGLYERMLKDHPDCRFQARPWNSGSEAFHTAMGWNSISRRGKTYFVFSNKR